MRAASNENDTCYDQASVHVASVLSITQALNGTG
jgi:hypothetical protein